MIRRTLAGTVLTGAVLAVAMTTMSAPAQAGDECSPPLCGRVSNWTSNHMLVAAIGSSGSAGGNPGRCEFLWETDPCRTKTLATGSTNNGGNSFKDVDGFTFTGTDFYYNGIWYPKNRYVRVYDPEWIVCTKVPGFSPRCTD